LAAAESPANAFTPNEPTSVTANPTATSALTPSPFFELIGGYGIFSRGECRITGILSGLVG
jgi:hypothetical protein